MEIIGYIVKEHKTGYELKRYTAKQGKLARRLADKKDLEYGATVTIVETLYKKEV